MMKIEVMLVDDDNINNYINTQIITDLNIASSINVFNNGEEALAYINTKTQGGKPLPPMLLILDYQMPVMDGMEFMIEYNRLAIPGKEHVAILLLGAGSSQADLDEFIKQGVKDYTEKPLEEETVLKIYHKYLAGKQDTHR